MADEKTGDPPVEIDVDTLSDEEASKLLHEGTAPEPKPDAKPEEAKPADGEDDDSDISVTVPHAKFHRANERRKQAEERAQAAEKASTLASQRLAELLQASKPAPQAQAEDDEPDIPDPKLDPMEYLEWDRAEKVRRSKEEKTQTVQKKQQTEQEQWLDYAVGEVAKRWDRVKVDRPEIDDAYQSWQKSQLTELERLGYRDRQLAQQMAKIEIGYADYCVRNNVAIEDFIVGLAESRGWTKPVPNGAANGHDKSGGDPQRDPTTGKFKAAAEIDAIEATKQKAKSLGGGGAPVSTDELSPEDILNMSDEDFAKFKAEWDKKKGEGGAMKKAFGL